MDKLNRDRRILRRQLEKHISTCSSELLKTVPDKCLLSAHMEVMKQTQDKIAELDGKMLDVMYDEGKEEDVLEKEVDESQSFILKYFAMKHQIEERLNPAPLIPLPSEAELEVGSQAGELRTQDKRFKLPKVELMKYDGDLRNWLTWWSQFDKSLIQGSKAYNLVKTYPLTAANYPLAIQDLKDNFGRTELLQDVFVREFLSIIFESVRNRNKLTLQELSIAIESHMRTLEELKIHTADPVVILYPLVLSSLPEPTLRAWTHSSQSKVDGKKLDPKKSQLDLLRDFIKEEVKSEQVTTLALNTFNNSSDAPKDSRRKEKWRQGPAPDKEDIPTAAGLFTGAKPKFSCLFCDGGHESDRCIKAQSMPYDQKQLIIRNKKACGKCLRTGHNSKKCRFTFVKCLLCGGAHYAIVCKVPDKKTEENTAKETKDIEVGAKAQLVNLQCSRSVLLYSLKVNLVAEDGQTYLAKLVNDPGGQQTYGKAATLKKVHPKKLGNQWLQNLLFGGGASPAIRYPVYQVGMKPLPVPGEDEQQYRRQPRQLIKLLGKDKLCADVASVPHGPWINELADLGITLSDVGGDFEEVDILVGMEMWNHLLTGRMEKLSCGLHAIETTLGWVLGGKLPETSYANAVVSLFNQSVELSNLWNLDVIGIRDPIETKSVAEEEKETLLHFNQNVSRDADGRYTVALPWNGKESHLPSNYNVAVKRLQSATTKLQSEKKWSCYNAVFIAWEKEGIIREVQGNPNEGHYLPHRPVFKDSLTTPVRPVFDASCRIKGGISLNECVSKGPNLIELIPSIMLRFQEKKVGVTADIRKAFQMIKVREEDQPFQRFLWWTDEKCNKIKVYQHQRVVFGASCSPFLLGATINFHLNKHSDPFAKVMLNQFYVDNFLISVDSKEEYLYVREKATKIMADACMELREWSSSADDFEDGEEEVSILGLKWNRKLDSISCVINDVDLGEKVTKRTISSAIARQFDPMGYLSPATIQAKILLQKAWMEESKSWNTALSPGLTTQFKAWCLSLTTMKNIRIPRHRQVPDADKLSLHVFGDASKDAYAATVVLRSEGPSGVKCQQLFSKSRLAPLEKGKTSRNGEKPKIPRLELMGAEIATRIASLVKDGLRLPNIPTTFWTDSAVTLAWIQRHGDWGVFVYNRVQKIHSSSERSQWRHIPGTLNPADLPSRGCSPQQLVESRWWEKPDWLYLQEEEWPKSVPSFNENLIEMEMKRVAVNLAPVADSITDDITPKTSSYRRNVAVIARCLRWWKLKTDRDSPLTLEELRRAEVSLVKNLQKFCFPGITTSYKNHQVFCDKDGLLRVKTRLLHREDTEAFITPILLPKTHPIVDSLIVDFHQHHGHGGVNFIREKLREKYWIANSRVPVKKIVGKCVTCLRFSAKPLEVDPAPLPMKRISDGDPFTTTGVDLAGPIILESNQKAWIVLYTCAVYRCIYLDLVLSISTESFLGSLERFISICGRPNNIYSDNGTNFVGSANFLRQVNFEDLQKESKIKQIEWIFNPPTASWWGGFFERMIRSVKGLLKRILKKSTLSYDQMRTCLAGVQTTINDRPLTVVSESSGDLHPLCPSMFLRPLRIGTFPELELCSSLSDRFRKMKEIQRSCQDRFRKEYLSLLTMPPAKGRKWLPKVGDVVLVGADNKKRFDWPLGLIQELYPGGDGPERTAKVKTCHGHLIRPLQRLYPLEISSQQETEELRKIGAEPVPVETDPEPRVLKTRRGRTIKKPNKYGKWNY